MKLPEVEGFILAGGLSRRMGSPKGLLRIEGETILARVARAVGDVVERLSIVTDREQEVTFLGMPVVPDTVKNSGPLGGLHAAFCAATSGPLFVISCDLPFVSSHLIHSLWSMHGQAPATVPSVGGRVQPLCGFYERSLLREAEIRLRSAELAMRPFLAAIWAQIVALSSLPDPFPDWHLLNVNTPEDLAAALAAVGGS
ncbi:MAG: molybdenum cofactor guanylyltransferase, partial [Proteobacteria bacterium]|nr:molybdenum cofactor guanylyltransferase [Pseudomonadota bacterium]